MSGVNAPLLRLLPPRVDTEEVRVVRVEACTPLVILDCSGIDDLRVRVWARARARV